MSELPVNQIITGDCLEVMQEWPDGRVDLVCVDPPFVGLAGGYDRHGLPGGVSRPQSHSITVGDPWRANLEWVNQAKRVSRLGAMVFCTHHFLSELAVHFTDWRRVALLTWYKRNACPTGANVPHFTSEFIWCFAKRPGLAWDRFNTTVFDVSNLQAGCLPCPERITNETGAAVHPTQKPLALMVKLLSVLSGGGIVLDCFAGTGTTCVAAKMLGRKYIGIEIDPAYAQIARERLRAVDTGVPIKEARAGQLALFNERTP